MPAKDIVISKKIRLSDYDPSDSAGLDKDKAKLKTEDYAKRIGEQQALLYANAKHSVLLIFQGMDASGKDGCGRRVLEHVNPLGVATTNFKVPSSEERAHDYLWRVHKAVPRYGEIGVFNRSHYEAVLVERVAKIVPKEVWSKRYDQIVQFERMLVENNVIILKFYLHISKEEQAERFQERLTDPKKHWKWADSDLTTRQLWDNYIPAYEDMLNATSHKAAPWHLIPANRNWYRDHLVTSIVASAMEGLKMKWPKPTQDLSKIKFK